MKRFRPLLLTILLTVISTSIYLLFWPVLLPITEGDVERISYDDAKSRINRLKELDNDQINAKCGTIFLDQGKKSAKTIVFYHGFTNCPEQFRELGQRFFTQGYNVLIPRLPMHGYKDRLTDKPSSLTTLQLALMVKETVYIAQGLGESVEIGGISGGGVMAAWAGYYYSAVKKVIIMAPLFLPYDLDDLAIGPLVRAKPFLPEYYRWWDPETKEKISGPDYAYPRFSFKGALEFLEMSYIFTNDLNSTSNLRNKDLKIVYITTENDKAVKNSYNEKIIDVWSDKLNRESVKHVFPSYYEFNHDIIDPNQPTAKPEIVYNKIFELTLL